jgi:heavy metal sensor kinase
MNWRSLAFRLTALYCGLLLVLGASFSLFTVFSFERYASETIRANVAARASEMWGIIAGVLDNPAQTENLVEQRFSPEEQDRFFRIRLNGKTVYRSDAPDDDSFDPARIPVTPVTSDPVYRTYGHLILYARRFTTPDRRMVIIESGQSDLFGKGMEFSLLTSLMIGLPLLLIAAAAGGYMLMRRALTPVEVMINAAEAISFNNPSNRLPLMGTGDRVEALGIALNRMLDRLDSAYQHANRFSSDAAHELRTPLAIIQGELEFVLSQGGVTPEIESAIANVHEEATRLSKIVDSLLTLSRMDRPSVQRPYGKVDLYALAAETVDQMQLLAAENQITLRGPTGVRTIVNGDRDRLKQVFVNLLDNGIKYNVPGGYVAVDVASSGNTARVTVADSGIGIAPEHQEYIFDRFYRVSTNRGEVGAGLGLAIVKSICHAHGGTITVISAPGAGTTLSVTLPLTASETAASGESRTGATEPVEETALT